jgi:serine/threonine-protein kinase
VIRPEAFLDVATSISDGSSVDWSVLGASADLAEDPALLRQLELIARITAAHRDAAREEENRTDRQRWGHLLIKEQLGAGSFGTVYRAHDPRLERDVALKIYSAGTLPDSSLAALFAEGRLLARVRHPNVVIVHGLEQQGGEVGLWLELIDGKTLADEVRNGGPLGFREAALIGQDLCRALAAVHLAGLVHRDIKPRNVMRERGGRIVLMDFGLGRDLEAAGGGAGDSRGTPLYMAPELFDGAPASVSSDIYSIGVSLFYLVTGSYPVMADSRQDLEESHREGKRRLLNDLRPDLPQAFVQVVERACAADANARYKTPGEMQAALSGALGMSADPSGEIDFRKRDRRRTIINRAGWIAAALVLALASTLFVTTQLSRRPPDATAAAKPTENSMPSVVGADPYQIQAAFHRVSASGSEEIGGFVTIGDRLFVEVQATKPVHVYIVNYDDNGESYLLFPLPGQSISNPLPAGKKNRLPGKTNWTVTSSGGGKEHFVVIASPGPLDTFEQALAKLPKPEKDRPVVRGAPLSSDVLRQLPDPHKPVPRPAPQPNRAPSAIIPEGGPVPEVPASLDRTKPMLETQPGPSANSMPARPILPSVVPLGPGFETVTGSWVRELSVENFGRKSPRR